MINSTPKCYDGTEIIFISTSDINTILEELGPGIYGFDTECCIRTKNLKLIQISSESKCYIIHVDYVDALHSKGLRRFLARKDRVKVGVDIDIDRDKLLEFLSQHVPVKQKTKYPIIRGMIDIQVMAILKNETVMSLNALSSKYLKQQFENHNKHGTYDVPTIQDIIYAANDSVMSRNLFLAMNYITQKPNPVIELYDLVMESLKLACLGQCVAKKKDRFITQIANCYNWGSSYSYTEKCDMASLIVEEAISRGAMIKITETLYKYNI